MKYGKRKMSMGDEDMGAIAKMEKGGIVKMMKGGKVGYKKGGLVEDIQKLERGGKGKSFPDLTGDGKVTFADVLKGRGVK